MGMIESLEPTTVPGVFVPRHPVYLRSDADAIARALLHAERAAELGTIGVGAVALGSEGQLVAVAENRVLEGGALADPTAHAEMGLLRYLGERNDVRLISSLEPCLMCGGALRAAGIRTDFVAEDGKAALRRGDFRRCGDPATRARAKGAFVHSLAPARAICVQSPSPGQGLRNPDTLAYRHPLRAALIGMGARFGVIDAGEIDAQGREDAAAIVDPFGNWLVCADDRGLEPPVIRAIREYSRLRHAFWSDDASACLPHLRHCLVLTRLGPESGPRGEMVLGAYGAALDRNGSDGSVGAWRYRVPRQSPAELEGVLETLPDLYRLVIGLRIELIH